MIDRSTTSERRTGPDVDLNHPFEAATGTNTACDRTSSDQSRLSKGTPHMALLGSIVVQEQPSSRFEGSERASPR